MSEANKAVVRKFLQMLEAGDPSMADEIIATDFVSHSALEGQEPGIDGVKQMVAMIGTAFPDLKVNIMDQIAEGDKVVTLYTDSGTHQGDFLGVPATGKKLAWMVTPTTVVVNGKITESGVSWDRWGLMQQLEGGENN